MCFMFVCVMCLRCVFAFTCIVYVCVYICCEPAFGCVLCAFVFTCVVFLRLHVL